MLLDVVLVIVGVAVLSIAADRFVAGAARLSTILRLSPVLIGAIVIGFGTSAPELLVSILATLRGEQDIAFGNVVGSNTANILLVLGVAAMLRPAFVEGATLRREVPVALGAVGLLSVVLLDGRVTLIDGLLLLAGAVVALGTIVVGALRDRAAFERMQEEVSEFEGEVTGGAGQAVLIAAIGLVGVLLGAEALVRGAQGLAISLGISPAIVGLTVVAIGTSLPELVTAIVAARKGESDLVVGNVLGSNVFNALPVAGVAGVLDTVALDPAFRLNVLAMFVAALVGALFLFTGRRLVRAEGVSLVALFMLWLTGTGTGVLG